MANNTKSSHSHGSHDFDMRQSEETWSNFIKLAIWTGGGTIVTLVLLALFVV